jgi:hypothetical protein
LVLDCIRASDTDVPIIMMTGPWYLGTVIAEAVGMV